MWSSTGLLVLGRIWGSLCTFLILLVTARQALNGEEFGRFTFYIAVFAVLDALSDLGTGSLAVQLTADNPTAIRAVLRRTMRIRVRAALFGVALVGGGAFLFQEPDAALILLASLYPITNAFELTATVFKNRLDWRVQVTLRAASNGLSLAAVLGLVALEVSTPALYLLVIAAASTLANITLHRLCSRHIPSGEEGTAPGTWELFRRALPLGIGALCQQAYFYVDNLFVRALEGETALGQYNVAVRFMSISIMVAIYASLTALPWFTREHAEGRLGAALAQLGIPLFALASFAVGLLLPHTELMLSLFGSEFEVAASSLQVLLFAALAVYLGALRMTALVAAGAGRAVLVVTVAALGINLIGNPLLIPSHGIEGAALATLATEVAVVLGAGFSLRKAGIDPLGGQAPKWALSGLALLVGYGVGAAFALS